MKYVVFMGGVLACLRAFPADVRQDTGFQIDKIQRGESPDDWKPMKTIGKGVREIQIKDVSGQYRVVYVVDRGDLVYALHTFKKKTRQTRKADIDLARQRLKKVGVLNG